MDIVAEPANRADLKLAGHRENRSIAFLLTPGFLLVFCLLALPTGWLFWLSFFSGDAVSLEHYERMIASSAYAKIYLTTFKVSFITTAICILVGYPLAYLLSQLPPKIAALLLPFVLLPFWTSLLVRTYAWLVLLQRRGIINEWLIDFGLIDQPLQLVHNLTGTIIGMTHIMLPFMVLPLYGAMRNIDMDLMRAAAAMGATPAQAFRGVFFPLSIPGLFAGTLLVFVICLGFYVTPELLGGGRVTTISMKIEQNINTYFDWGAASSLGVVLFVVVVALLATLNRIMPIESMFGDKS